MDDYLDKRLCQIEEKIGIRKREYVWFCITPDGKYKLSFFLPISKEEKDLAKLTRIRDEHGRPLIVSCELNIQDKGELS